MRLIEGEAAVVEYNGRVSFGAGRPAHKRDLPEEPYAPCVTRKMTPEERDYYGVEVIDMAKERINKEMVENLIDEGLTANEIAERMHAAVYTIWKRAKSYGRLKKLNENGHAAAKPDPKPEAEKPAAKPEKPKAVPARELKKPDPFPQDQEDNEYRYLSPGWIDSVARGLTAGAVKHPGETWRTIPCEEHLWRALRHINLYLSGNREDDHICNASMRLMMAFETGSGDDE